MASVYILYSNKGGPFYVGSCVELEKRLMEHFDKKYKESFTAKWDDWELFFSINNLIYEQARKIEMHIKKMKSNAYYRNLKKNIRKWQKKIKKRSSS